MPFAPPRSCCVPGCPEAIAYHGRCAKHQAQGAGLERNRLSPTRRGYGRRWEATRDAFLRHHPPLCARCLSLGRTKEAEQVDHIRPLVNGGTSDWSNLQSLCAACNGWKGDREIDFRLQTTEEVCL